MTTRRRAIAILFFILSLALFSFGRSRLVPAGAAGAGQARYLTGDEPSYYLLAHSLVSDLDFNIFNNRVRKDGRHFGVPNCEGHGARKDWEKGEIYSVHTPGTAMAIAPAYALGLRGFPGPRAAVCMWLNLLAALLTANVYLLCDEIGRGAPLSAGEGGHYKPAIIGTAAVAFTPPIVFYANLAYPELPGALCALYALRTVLPSLLDAAPMGRRAARARLISASLAAAFLPWLSFRFFPPALVLIILLWKEARRAVPESRAFPAALAAVFAASLALFCAYQHRAFGSFNPAAGYLFQNYGGRGIFSRGTLDGVLGIILDSGHGILTWSPVYLLSLTGALLLLRERRALGLWLAVLFCAMYLPGANFVFWWGGFAPPPRYLAIEAPLLGAALCYALSRKPPAAFTALFFLLLAVSLWAGWTGIRHPSLLYRHMNLMGHYLPKPAMRIFPCLVRKNPLSWPLAAAWGTGVLAVNLHFLRRWDRSGA